MKKKDVKNYFKAIQHGDLNQVMELVEENIDYVHVTNFAPPKKDDGQSGLQIAFKTGNFEIAAFLIKQGADVNFQETSDINEWTTPVLHDCIRATIFNCNLLQKEDERFDKAFALLQAMLSKKANPNATDSYGNNVLNRALLDANQMINHPNFASSPKTLTQIKLVFEALKDAGADINQSNPNRESLVQQIKLYRMEKYDLLAPIMK